MQNVPMFAPRMRRPAYTANRSMAALRDENLERLRREGFDVLVVGGGINGAVSVACLSGRGAKVALIDRGDFAGFTSQESSNLAWGGIKYLETFEFGLVRKLCVSRNLLLERFPSTVQEIRFFVAHEKSFRHGLWKLFMGSWLYWFMGSLFTKPPRLLSKEGLLREESVIAKDLFDGGFEYSDAYLYDNDARFVWSFIRRALDQGATCANYVECLGAVRDSEGWRVSLRNRMTNEVFETRARVLINAAGPYVDALNQTFDTKTTHRHVFSKGIHLVVPKLTKSKRVLTFFADDGRLFFVIPMGTRTCIGTTDTRVDKPETHVTDEDRAFVLDNINKRLRLPKPLTVSDIVAERCGVRPLAIKDAKDGARDWTQLSRKHAAEVDHQRAQISIFGGKLTDCINVGEEVATLVQDLGVALPRPNAEWYGEPTQDRRDAYAEAARAMSLDALTSPSSSELLSTRLWRRYGERAFGLLDAIRRDKSQAELLIENAEYLRCEVELAAREEMVTTLDDFLRRRSKIALVVSRSVMFRSEGLKRACALFFGPEHAEASWRTYFGEHARIAGPNRDSGHDSGHDSRQADVA
jgi:glycerol-3-phosphate dehydrogenase